MARCIEVRLRKAVSQIDADVYEGDLSWRWEDDGNLLVVSTANSMDRWGSKIAEYPREVVESVRYRIVE